MLGTSSLAIIKILIRVILAHTNCNFLTLINLNKFERTFLKNRDCTSVCLATANE